MPPRIGSLFTGYGGLDLAVEAWFAARTVWTSDIDAGAAKIISARYPWTPNLGDVTAVDWATVQPVDIVTGGWPCQPWSSAGKKKGKDDDRALWPEVERAIRLLRPSVVLLENVSAIAYQGELERAVAALAVLGYVGSWHCIRASDIGAPHGRERIFIVATHPDRPRLEGRHRPHWQDTPRWPEADGWGPVTTGRSEVPAYPDDERCRSIRRQHTAKCHPHRRCGAHQLWGDYEPAIRRWEALTRHAPEPTETRPTGAVRLAPRFVEWMMGLPEGWVTDVPGLPYRDQLRALGNGVVPHQAYEALRRAS